MFVAAYLLFVVAVLVVVVPLSALLLLLPRAVVPGVHSRAHRWRSSVVAVGGATLGVRRRDSRGSGRCGVWRGREEGEGRRGGSGGGSDTDRPLLCARNRGLRREDGGGGRLRDVSSRPPMGDKK